MTDSYWYANLHSFYHGRMTLDRLREAVFRPGQESDLAKRIQKTLFALAEESTQAKGRALCDLYEIYRARRSLVVLG